MSFTGTIPTPEQIQLLMGIHPLQAAASQAMTQQAQPEGQAVSGGENEEIDKFKAEHPEELRRGGEESEGNSSESEGNSDKSEPSPTVARPDSVIRGLGGTIPAATPAAPEGESEAHTAPSLGRPAPGPHPLGGTIGPPAPPETIQPESGGTTSISPQPIQPVPLTAAQQRAQQDQERTAKDQAALDAARAKPAGVVNFQHRHHILGPLVRGLEIAGSVVSPGVMQQIPGTTLNKSADLARKTGAVREDLATEKQSADIENKEEVDEIKRKAEADREADRQTIADLKQQALDQKDAMRNFGYDKKTGQFTHAGAPYTPKNVEEGAVLEANFGVSGRYTDLWLKEKRNQAPVTHIHNASAESEHYSDVKTAYKRQYGHEPQSPDDFNVFNAMLKGERPVHPVNVQKELSDAERDRQLENDKESNRFKKEWNAAYADGKPDQATLDGLQKEHQDRAAQIESTYQERIKTLKETPQPSAVTHPNGGGGSGAPQAVTTSKSKQAVKVGQTVPVNRGGQITYHKVVSINNGKPRLDPNPVAGP